MENVSRRFTMHCDSMRAYPGRASTCDPLRDDIGLDTSQVHVGARRDIGAVELPPEFDGEDEAQVL